jgi:hypothetical protein
VDEDGTTSGAASGEIGVVMAMTMARFGGGKVDVDDGGWGVVMGDDDG